MQASLATIARFFRIGLELGICEPDTVRAWALSVIDSMDEPPGEIIEVSWRQPVAQLVEDLNGVRGDTDLPVIRRWLLHELWLSISRSNDSLEQVVRQGMQLASAIGDKDLYYQFDGIDDALQLAACGTYGTIHECRAELDKLLKSQMASRPFT